MATEKQINSNRLNAQKSTGPRTAEGKAVVAQNAIKHGLFARENVIKCEKQADFDHFREELLTGLKPAGAVEAMLAERIVSLSWRLKRAERMNSEVIDVKIARIEAGSRDWSERNEAGLVDPETGKSELTLGWATIDDFKYSQVLERLLMYEKRIESSLYKAMNELQKIQHMRKTEYAEATESESTQPSPSLRDEAATQSEVQMDKKKKQSQIAGLRSEILSTQSDNAGDVSGCLWPGVVPEILKKHAGTSAVVQNKPNFTGAIPCGRPGQISQHLNKSDP
jgi:hypothetical protein